MFVFDFLNDWQLVNVLLTLQDDGLNVYSVLLTVYSMLDVFITFRTLNFYALSFSLFLSLSPQFILKLQNGILASNESKCSYFRLRLSADIHGNGKSNAIYKSINKSIRYKKQNFSVLIQIFFKWENLSADAYINVWRGLLKRFIHKQVWNITFC